MDFLSTGVVGAAAVITALLRRAEEGGSFTIDVSQLAPLYVSNVSQGSSQIAGCA